MLNKYNNCYKLKLITYRRIEGKIENEIIERNFFLYVLLLIGRVLFIDTTCNP